MRVFSRVAKRSISCPPLKKMNSGTFCGGGNVGGRAALSRRVSPGPGCCAHVWPGALVAGPPVEAGHLLQRARAAAACSGCPRLHATLTSPPP
jgi:hypothetical protein